MSRALTVVEFRGRGAQEPLSERRARTRLRLLRAAAGVFSAKSVPEATVEDVLRQAGVSRRTFYQLFADKVDLLATLYADSVNHLHALRLEVTAQGETGVERLLRGFDLYADFHSSAASLIRVLASEAMRPESPLGPMREALIDRTVELYCRRFAEVESTELDPLVVRALVLLSEALHLHMVKTTAAMPDDIERVRSAIHRVVRRTLAPG